MAVMDILVALFTNRARKHSDMKECLLQNEEKNLHGEDMEAFTNSGFWSQLTFQWLNPTFRRGQIQKLELAHVPCVPSSEMAKNASSLLEESIRKQKFEDLLAKAIFRATWKSLVLNATFAGQLSCTTTSKVCFVFCFL